MSGQFSLSSPLRDLYGHSAFGRTYHRSLRQHISCCARETTASAPHPHDSRVTIAISASSKQQHPTGAVEASVMTSRRQQLMLYSCTAWLLAQQQVLEAQAIGFQKELKKKKIPLDEYATSPDGVKYYDLIEGSGKEVEAGSGVTVHFDCLFRGIDVVSSRSARLLAGNRTIAEPFAFVAGKGVSVRTVYADENANGLFAGGGGPKPPPVLSTAVIGMKKGGKRSIIVPPEVGYGSEGLMEIPPGATFELQVELLDVN